MATMTPQNQYKINEAPMPTNTCRGSRLGPRLGFVLRLLGYCLALRREQDELDVLGERLAVVPVAVLLL